MAVKLGDRVWDADGQAHGTITDVINGKATVQSPWLFGVKTLLIPTWMLVADGPGGWSLVAEGA